MLKPQRLLARHPLHESSKLRLRALKPRDRARIEPRRAALLAAHGPLITIDTFRRRFAHTAVTLPGRGEQVEQIRSHAITSVSRWERDITRLSPPLTRTPSGITANNPDRSASERTNCQRNWAIYPLQTTCTQLTSTCVTWVVRKWLAYLYASAPLPDHSTRAKISSPTRGPAAARRSSRARRIHNRSLYPRSSRANSDMHRSNPARPNSV